MFHKLKAPIFVMSLGLFLTCCSEVEEEALQADTAEESASDLITYFEKADPKLKQLAKTAGDALEKGNFPLAIQCINQLKAKASELNVDQFMVVSEAGVNIQNALINAADNGDKKAQQLLNMQSASRRN